MKCWLCDDDALELLVSKRGPDGKQLVLQLVYCRIHTAELHRTYQEALASGALQRWLDTYNGHIRAFAPVAHALPQVPAAADMVGTPPQNTGPSERA